MVLADEATIGHPIFLTPNASVPTTTMYEMLPPPPLTGSIREYSQIGDGVHLMQQSLALVPMVDLSRPRPPQRLVQKVSVVGCHVLRYVTQAHNVTPTHDDFYYLHSWLPLFELDVNDSSAGEDNGYWVEHTAGPQASGFSRLQTESYSVRFPCSSWDSSPLRFLNWKICLGMLCIIAIQALLKIAYKHFYNDSYL